MEYLLKNSVNARIGTEKYQCTIEWRNGKFIADEPETVGGKGIGPDPYTLLLSSLGTCTLVTLRMYIDRKMWDIPEIGISLNMYHELKDEKNITIINSELKFLSAVTAAQRERLVQIAKVCPVSKLLEGEIRIRAI